MNILNLIGRDIELFSKDVQIVEKELSDTIANSSFLV